MAVLINKETGLAEDVAPGAMQQALSSGTHEIPVISPNGEMGSAPHESAQDLLYRQGYKQPTPEQLGDLMNYAKHSTPGEMLKTFAEGTGDALTFGLLLPPNGRLVSIQKTFATAAM